jgi:hypothetical protein
MASGRKSQDNADSGGSEGADITPGVAARQSESVKRTQDADVSVGPRQNEGASSGGATQRGGERRSGSEKRKRGPIIGFRATEEERGKIQAAADRAGLTVGSYVRSRSLKTPTTRAVRRPPVATAQLAQILGLLGAAGGEFQRIGKHFDVGEGAPAPDIHSALAGVREAASAILQALGKRR